MAGLADAMAIDSGCCCLDRIQACYRRTLRVLVLACPPAARLPATVAAPLPTALPWSQCHPRLFLPLYITYSARGEPASAPPPDDTDNVVDGLKFPTLSSASPSGCERDTPVVSTGRSIQPRKARVYALTSRAAGIGLHAGLPGITVRT